VRHDLTAKALSIYQATVHSDLEGLDVERRRRNLRVDNAVAESLDDSTDLVYLAEPVDLPEGIHDRLLLREANVRNWIA
jgi:hypothetical protein